MASAADLEADQAARAFHVALIYLGMQAVADAQKEWAKVPPVRGYATTAWLARARRNILNRNRMARDLAFAFYRLNRALRTGETIQTPDSPNPRTSLNALRKEFADLASSFVPKNDPSIPKSDRDVVAAVTLHRPGGDKQINAIRINGVTRDWINKQEAEYSKEIDGALTTLGPKAMDRKIGEAEEKLRKLSEQQRKAKDQRLRDKNPIKAVEEKRREAHRVAGSRVAASSDRITKNGARGLLYEVGKADKKAIGFVRASRTGTPCGFCAMLISRGFVLYSSRKKAGDYEGNEFHDNCQCYAIPVFSREHYEHSDLFAMNREYNRLWKSVAKGKVDPMNVWRRYMNRLHGRTYKKKDSAQAADAA